MSSEEDFFLKKMKGVSKVKDNNKVKKHKKLNLKKIKNDRQYKEGAESRKTTEPKTIKQTVFETNYINKKTKNTKIQINRKIDFHGLSVISAESLFREVIIESYKNQTRCILFVTGKGLYKPNSLKEDNLKNKPKLFYGKIRNSFIEWVKDPTLSKYILSFERAGIAHGGDGAFLVYLRKKKISNEML